MSTFFRKRILQTDFSNKLGLPILKLAKKFEELTEGEVTKEEAMFPKSRES